MSKAETAGDDKRERLTVSLRYGYAIGNFGKSLQNSTIDLLFLFYLIDYLNTPPAVAGSILLAAAIADCLADLFFGHVVDQRGSSGPTYRRMIVQGTIASAITFPVMFLWPLRLPSFAILWAITWLLVFRLSYAIVDIPHNALLAALTRDSRERGRLSTLRFLFSSAGNLSVSGLIATCLPQQGHSTGGLTTYVGVVTLMYLFAMIGCTYAIGSARPTSLPRVLTAGSLIRALIQLIRNGHFVRVLAICMLAACLITMFARMAIFYAQSYLGDASRAAVLVSAQIVGQMASLALWSWLQDRMDKRRVALIAYGCFAASMIAFWLCATSAVTLAAILFFFAGAGLSGLTVMNWAMVPDTIEQTEFQTGERHEALTFGLLLTATKIASGLGAGLIGFALYFSGYGAADAAVTIRLPGIVHAMTVFPAIGAVICIAILASLKVQSAQSERA